MIAIVKYILFFESLVFTVVVFHAVYNYTQVCTHVYTQTDHYNQKQYHKIYNAKMGLWKYWR